MCLFHLFFATFRLCAPWLENKANEDNVKKVEFKLQFDQRD